MTVEVGKERREEGQWRLDTRHGREEGGPEGKKVADAEAEEKEVGSWRVQSSVTSFESR